jgi:hypothetical protein
VSRPVLVRVLAAGARRPVRTPRSVPVRLLRRGLSAGSRGVWKERRLNILPS